MDVSVDLSLCGWTIMAYTADTVKVYTGFAHPANDKLVGTSFMPTA